MLTLFASKQAASFYGAVIDKLNVIPFPHLTQRNAMKLAPGSARFQRARLAARAHGIGRRGIRAASTQEACAPR